MRYASDTPLIERVVEAIISGVPYAEEPLPKNSTT